MFFVLILNCYLNFPDKISDLSTLPPSPVTSPLPCSAQSIPLLDISGLLDQMPADLSDTFIAPLLSPLLQTTTPLTMSARASRWTRTHWTAALPSTASTSTTATETTLTRPNFAVPLCRDVTRPSHRTPAPCPQWWVRTSGLAYFGYVNSTVMDDRRLCWYHFIIRLCNLMLSQFILNIMKSG